MSAAMRRDGAVRVTHLVPALFDDKDGVIGGAERYALELARHMADALPTELVTFGARDRIEEQGQLTVRVIGHPWRVRRQPTNPFHPRVFGALRRATVIHCHQQHIVASSAAAAFARCTGRRVFVSDLGGGGWDVSSYLSTDRWYHGHLHISAYSRAVARHDGNPRAHVIYGGVDTRRFSPATRDRTGARVVFVGRLLAHKGIDYLIAGLPDGVPLDVIGRPYDPAYLADLERLGRRKRVAFRHECDDADLIASYRDALCVVLPSVYRDRYGRETRVPELLGQTPLEGMACGVPAVVTDVASLPEIVDDGVTGFIVPPNDPEALGAKIAWLRDHPARARTMGQAARAAVEERFTWPEVVRRCLGLYAA